LECTKCSEYRFRKCLLFLDAGFMNVQLPKHKFWNRNGLSPIMILDVELVSIILELPDILADLNIWNLYIKDNENISILDSRGRITLNSIITSLLSCYLKISI